MIATEAILELMLTTVLFRAIVKGDIIVQTCIAVKLFFEDALIFL